MICSHSVCTADDHYQQHLGPMPVMGKFEIKSQILNLKKIDVNPGIDYYSATLVAIRRPLIINIARLCKERHCIRELL